MRFYSHFSLLMVRSPGFGSMATNFMRPIQTRSRFASGTEYLKLARYYNSPDRSTKSTISHVDVLYVLVGTRFQVLFHSPPGVLFTFPSRYCSSIGHQVVFRLGGWSPRLPCGFLVSVRTPDTVAIVVISLTGLSPSSVDFPKSFCYDYCRFISPLPRMYFYSRFSLFRFRSPLLAKSRLISLPKGT